MSKEFFVWKTEYSVGNQTIDDQHKKLVAMINKLYRAFIEKKQSEEISTVMLELIDYMQYHFSTEENILIEKKYPFLNEHLTEHEYFKTELNNYKTQFQKSPSILTLKVMTFLQKWLREHILISDKKYSPYI